MAERTPDSPLSAELFRRCGHELVDRLADFLESVSERRLTPEVPLERIFGDLPAQGTLPAQGQDPETLLRNAVSLILSRSVLTAHPGFFGFINASAHPLGALGDLLASVVNQNVAAPYIGPVASAIERQTVAWIAELIRFGSESTGLLTSGGSTANLMGLHVARTKMATWDFERHGMRHPDATKQRIYATREVHSWLGKALRVLGFGTDAVSFIPTDGEWRLAPAALRQAIEQDKQKNLAPSIVVATCGTTSCGAVDPIEEIGAICREHGLWLHVDAAYGGFAAMAPNAPSETRNLAFADSVAVDPHKWLYIPFEAGCLLVKNEQDLLASFHQSSGYYASSSGAGVPPPFRDMGLQTSRGFRALKVWLCLQHLGSLQYARFISRNIQLACYLRDKVAACARLEVCSQSLSITTFRYVPDDGPHDPGLRNEYLDRLNERIVEQIQARGSVYPSHARLGGKYVIRVCVVNYNSSERDLDRLVEDVLDTGNKLQSSLMK